jgi:serine protease Do
LRKDVPSSLEDLQSIETHVEQLAARVSRAVVAVGVDGATGSGVVVSENGLVLTAAHVAGEPNREVRFTFPDGKTARGKTLGTNHEMDAGLMKIDDSGEWPHADVGDLALARLGDWVLGFGHPGGYDPQRPAVVRLGRIIRLGSGMLQSDCTLIGGDSGGPLFDMHGQVVGIHSRISDSVAANFHVPITAYRESWDRLVKGENWGGRRPGPRSFVGARGTDHPEGCRLERIEEGSPAARADLKAGDIVTKVNGRKIKDYDAFRRSVAEATPGEELTLTIRRDDEELSVTVTVEARRGRGRGRPAP